MPEPTKRETSQKSSAKTQSNFGCGGRLGRSAYSLRRRGVMEGPIPEEPVNTDASVGQDAQEIVVQEHNGRGVAQLLHDPEFLNQLIAEMETSRTLESVAEEIADKLSDALEDSSEFRRRLIDAFMSNEVARAKFISATIKTLA